DDAREVVGVDERVVDVAEREVLDLQPRRALERLVDPEHPTFRVPDEHQLGDGLREREERGHVLEPGHSTSVTVACHVRSGVPPHTSSVRGGGASPPRRTSLERCGTSSTGHGETIWRACASASTRAKCSGATGWTDKRLRLVTIMSVSS